MFFNSTVHHPRRAALRRLWILIPFLAAAGLNARDLPPREAPPNVLLILVDDLGFGDLSSYGAPDLRTPHIDRLIASGVRFDRFYANCPVCSPTRAALLTGRYPDLVGVPGVIRTHAADSWGFLSRSATLLPERLKPAGYTTAIIGKWHLGLRSPNTPTERGFDFFHGFLGDMMDDYYHHQRHGNDYMRRNLEVIHPEGHATDLFSDWAVRYLRDRADAPEPFFLYLAYNAPHTPIQPPADWLQKVRQRQPNTSIKRAKLVALIEHLDDGIGRVLTELRRSGLDRSTLVIFTSDNGGQLDVGGRVGPVRGGKQDMYEGGLRVPMGAAWPGRITAGSRSDAVAATMDLPPTLCEVAGVSAGDSIDGVSILPELLGTPRTDDKLDRDLVFVRREGNQRYQGQDYYALRRGPYKLLHNNPFAPLELYNLESDPAETHDISRSEPAVFRDLSRALRAHIQRAGAVPWQRADTD